MLIQGITKCIIDIYNRRPPPSASSTGGVAIARKGRKRGEYVRKGGSRVPVIAMPGILRLAAAQLPQPYTRVLDPTIHRDFCCSDDGIPP